MTRRIMLLDDDVSITDSIRRRLRSLSVDWQIVTCHSVDQAIAVIDSDHIDLVVSDIAMPHRDGFSFLEYMVASHHIETIPVVMLTGHGDTYLKRKALEMGATDLLLKPIETIDLRIRIENLLKLKSYSDKVRENEQNLVKLVRERTKELEASRVSLALRLAKIAEMRDETTGNHVVRVGCYSEILAKAIAMPDYFCNNIFLAAPMHDIGKIAIPDSILFKNGSLSEDEWKVMKVHCRLGEQMLREDPKLLSYILSSHDINSLDEKAEDAVLRMAGLIALRHHEKWNGAGYPDGLSGENIPIEARIVAIVDVFDALTTRRPYRSPLTTQEAQEHILGLSGTHFDPALVQAFSQSTSEIIAVKERLVDNSAREEAA